jgi:hypothetical protein
MREVELRAVGVGRRARRMDQKPRTVALAGERQRKTDMRLRRTGGAQPHALPFVWRAAPSRLKRRALIDHLRCTCERGSARVHRKCPSDA